MVDYASIESIKDINKRRNFFYMSSLYWFVWLIFHFSIVFFFWIILESTFLVWLFLWIWNFVALLIDIPIWVLQKYFKAKTLFVFACICIIICSLILLKFVIFTNQFSLDSENWILNFVWWIFEFFLNDITNLILLLIVWFLYWIIKEIFDVTSLSYIMNNSDPSEYASLFSKNWIFFWIWALVWLISAWVILSLDHVLAIILLIIFSIIMLIYIIYFFDNVDYSITFDTIKDIKFVSPKDQLEVLKNYTINTLNKDEFYKTIKKTKFIFMKPLKLESKFSLSDILTTTINSFSILTNIIFKQPLSIPLIWIICIILPFWFRDTFVATFQVEFLEKLIWLNEDNFLIKQTNWLISWYVLLWLLVIPVFTTQLFFIMLSKKIWIYLVILMWILISWISIFAFWYLEDLILVLVFWFFNSFWYAAVMPIWQALFSELYCKIYSNKYNQIEVDSNLAAAPLRMLLNFANVLWVVFWWVFIYILWFNWFFLFFWVLLLILFGVSIFLKPFLKI